MDPPTRKANAYIPRQVRQARKSIATEGSTELTRHKRRMWSSRSQAQMTHEQVAPLPHSLKHCTEEACHKEKRGAPSPWKTSYMSITTEGKRVDLSLWKAARSPLATEGKRRVPAGKLGQLVSRPPYPHRAEEHGKLSSQRYSCGAAISLD